MRTLIRKYRQELKEEAKEIRRKKDTRKECKNGYVQGLWLDRHNFRLKHIAYCMLRGRKYEEIERNHEWKKYKVNSPNQLDAHDFAKIEKLMEVPNEDARNSEKGPEMVTEGGSSVSCSSGIRPLFQS